MISIKTANILSENQIIQIHGLEAICRSYDKTNSSISLAQELNFHKDMCCFFLAYEEKMLAGIVSIFAPTMREAEISALIVPARRRQGLFKALLKKAAEELQKFDIKEVYIVQDTASDSGCRVLEKWCTAIDHSEYLLVYDKSFERKKHSPEVSVKQTHSADIEQTVRLALGVFGGSADEWTALYQKSILSPDILCFTAYFNKEPIGICSVNHTAQGLFIFGFGILAAHRRKGFGSAFLTAIVSGLMQDYADDILLEVDSENSGACKLYISNGFKEKVRFDYHKMSLSDIKEKIGL